MSFTPTPQFKFDPNQKHQTRAIESVVNLFDGYSPDLINKSGFIFNLDAVPNVSPSMIWFDKFKVLQNMNSIQQKNNDEDLNQKEIRTNQMGLLELSPSLEFDSGFTLDPMNPGTWEYPSFVVDMETGTGKTYVYLRTIYELKKKYNFSKFIIIVPSVAIFEGVKKSFDTLKSHFNQLYSGEPATLVAYDGQKLSGSIRNFATSKNTEILLMTIDSFTTPTKNVIFKPSDKLPGELLPYQYLQQTRPILILDESQNYNSEKSKAALRTLNPLFAVGYSATPRDKTNLVYRLTPYEAFRQNLVKKVQVAGVTETTTDTEGEIVLQALEYSGSRLTAKVQAEMIEGGITRTETFTLFHGDSLERKTRNPRYSGFIVNNIVKSENAIYFENGQVCRLSVHEESQSKEDVFRAQIRHTIKKHFERQQEFIDRKLKIKVLSLFFIDRVANYRGDNPIIKNIFIEEFEKQKSKSSYFSKFSAEEVQKAYFAQKKEKDKDLEIDTAIENDDKTQAEKDAEKKAYDLIMKDKEKLLSFDESTCFIFAHSALKEGWDNPNVFQICTLNQTVSEFKKRQEIGRGLRLCVDSNLERQSDPSINILTVIANESYESFVNQLQKEYREAGETEIPKPQNADHNLATRNADVFSKKEFKQFMSHLFQKTTYKITFNKEDFVRECLEEFKAKPFPDPQIIIREGSFALGELNISLQKVEHSYALIHVVLTDSDDPIKNKNTVITCTEGSVIGSLLKNEFLNIFKVKKITPDEFDPSVKFTNGDEITLSKTIKKSITHGQKAEHEFTQEDQNTHQPIPNFIQRAADTTKLTKTTILEIFNSFTDQQKQALKKNPEGFSNHFINVLKEVLANHIADKISYKIIDSNDNVDIEQFFPENMRYPQGEIIPGRQGVSLYNLVHAESGPEKIFVTEKLNFEEQILLFFKFPGAFKIPIPKIIGNYNPDWGAVRQDSSGQRTLELIRETKGGPVDTLRFSNESRKITCAKKYFSTIGVDYKTIWPDVFASWWMDDSEDPTAGPLFNK